jgi:hypothetical protein
MMSTDSYPVCWQYADNSRSSDDPETQPTPAGLAAPRPETLQQGSSKSVSGAQIAAPVHKVHLGLILPVV